MVDVIITHGGFCPDGFTAAWILSKRWPAAEIVYANYSDQNLEANYIDKDILMVDFCLPRDKLLALKQVANSLLVLDHHKTAMEACGDLDFCVFDMTRSGAGLAWDFVYNGGVRKGSLPWFVEYIEYRDLGHLYRNELDPHNIKEVLAVVDSYPQTFESWDYLSSQDPSSLIKEGRGILRYKNKLVEQLAASAEVLDTNAFGREVPIIKYVNSPILQSDIGNFLVREDPTCIGMVWYQNSKGSKFSLRSEIEDCSAVASLVKEGGGHMRASGFSAGAFNLSKLIKNSLKD